MTATVREVGELSFIVQCLRDEGVEEDSILDEIDSEEDFCVRAILPERTRAYWRN